MKVPRLLQCTQKAISLNIFCTHCSKSVSVYVSAQKLTAFRFIKQEQEKFIKQPIGREYLAMLDGWVNEPQSGQEPCEDDMHVLRF